LAAKSKKGRKDWKKKWGRTIGGGGKWNHFTTNQEYTRQQIVARGPLFRRDESSSPGYGSDLNGGTESLSKGGLGKIGPSSEVRGVKGPLLLSESTFSRRKGKPDPGKMVGRAL